MGCSTPGFPIHHQLPEFTQTHVQWHIYIYIYYIIIIIIENGLTWFQREANQKSADVISSSNAKARSNWRTRKSWQWQHHRIQNFLLFQGTSAFRAGQAFSWLHEAHQDKEGNLLYSVVYWSNVHLTQDNLTETPRIAFDQGCSHLGVHTSCHMLSTITGTLTDSSSILSLSKVAEVMQ